MPPVWSERVKANVELVRKTHADALGSLSSAFWLSAQEQEHLKALRSLAQPIVAWAARGERASDLGTEPDNGWTRWQEAGNEYLKGIASLLESGQSAYLDDVGAVVAEAPATSAKAIAQGVNVAATEVRGVAESLLGIPLWALALGAVAVVMAPTILAQVRR